MKKILLPLCALLSAIPATAAPPAPQEREVSISFLRFGAIRDFRPVGNDVVYFQGEQRIWYRATLAGPCFNLPGAIRIGLDSRYGNVLDNTTSLLVEGERCRIQSLVRSGPPPRRRG